MGKTASASHYLDRVLKAPTTATPSHHAVRLRKATIDDLPGLVEIEFEAFSWDRISRRSWRDLLMSPSAVVVVAADKARIAGSYVTLLNARTHVARLYTIAVAFEARRQGVAQLLVEDAISRAAQNGASVLRLETRIDNIPAQKLFELCGFEPFGRVSQYYEDGAEAIRYERSLLDNRSAPTNFAQ